MRKSIFIFIISLIIAATFYSCEKDSKSAPTSTLVGVITVVDEFGQAITDRSGVTIGIDGTNPLVKGITNVKDQFTVDSIPPGTYDVSLSKYGFGTFKFTGKVFYGDEKPQYLAGYIAERSSTSANNLTLTYNATNRYITATANVNPAGTTSQARFARFFAGSNNSVSDSSYISTSVNGTSTNAVSVSIYMDPVKFPNGTTVYVKAYGCSYYDYSYLNVETFLSVYTTVNTSSSSNVASIVLQ